MSLDNQRNPRLAIARVPQFLAVAGQVADEMNGWARGVFGRAGRCPLDNPAGRAEISG